ncbi:MAG: VWA domain-containing protein, partial [Chloroflexota bacterium]
MTFTFVPGLVLLLLLPAAAYIGFPRQRYRRPRDITSLVLRLIILSLLILALSGAQVVRSADKLAVVFLVDVSDSIDPETQEAAFDYVREAVEGMNVNDSAGIVLFGTNAVVERQVSNVASLGNVQSAPVTSNTDLAEAIRLGLALFPTDAARRMVVLSDGRPTVGDTEAAAGLAAAADVQIDYVLFDPSRVPEVQVTDVEVPSTVGAGQRFDLQLAVEAEAATPAEIVVFDSGSIIYEEEVDLAAGENRFGLSLQAGESGFKDFRVQVRPQGEDGYYQNNELSAFSRVIGPPRVLVMATDAQEAVYIVQALEGSGLQVDVRAPDELPIGITALAQYDSIVMTNVPARQLSPARMEAIDRYVRDLGGGLVFIGGPESYGPGGYFQTPIEDALPVETRIRDQQRLPQLTIAYLIDTSGSMGAIGPSGVQNIELAKEAIIRSINFLQPTDNAGVASFDTNGSWIADIQPVLDRRGLQTLVATLRAGGGTDILAGMRLAAESLVSNPAPRKHIILLTDGGASPNGLLELTSDINEEAEVTTSVIAIGAGAAGFLDDMADVGDGNFYLIDNVSQIPTIFTQETVLATRSYIIEEQFFPVITAQSQIMNGITSSPPLRKTPKDRTLQARLMKKVTRKKRMTRSVRAVSRPSLTPV